MLICLQNLRKCHFLLLKLLNVNFFSKPKETFYWSRLFHCFCRRSTWSPLHATLWPQPHWSAQRAFLCSIKPWLSLKRRSKRREASSTFRWRWEIIRAHLSGMETLLTGDLVENAAVNLVGFQSCIWVWPVSVSPQPKVVTDTDETELARQLERLERENAEVDGDDDAEEMEAKTDD